MMWKSISILLLSLLLLFCFFFFFIVFTICFTLWIETVVGWGEREEVMVL